VSEAVIAELRITPSEEKSARTLAAILRVLEASPLAYQVTAMGTLLEGSLDDILHVVRSCHQVVRQMSSRVLLELSIDDREAPPGELAQSLKRLEEASSGAQLERRLPPR
jgi:uncharacterized protein YqgV (UPF0045/DUF77 family)